MYTQTCGEREERSKQTVRKLIKPGKSQQKKGVVGVAKGRNSTSCFMQKRLTRTLIEFATKLRSSAKEEKAQRKRGQEKQRKR